MKRTYSDIGKELSVHKPKFLPCDICIKRVYNYEMCTSPYVYCRDHCLGILILSQENGMLHQNIPDFNIKRVKSEDDLMIIEEEDMKEYINSWEAF